MTEATAPSSAPHYDMFLAGELVDLVLPNERAIDVDRWHTWLNDQTLTRNMEQGMYPTSAVQQEAWPERSPALREQPAEGPQAAFARGLRSSRGRERGEHQKSVAAWEGRLDPNHEGYRAAP